jgi:hypothetical protein
VCCFESDQEDPILSKSIWLGIVIRRGLLNSYANFMLDLSCKHSLLFFSFKITEAFTRSLAVWLTAVRPFLYARPQLQLPGRNQETPQNWAGTEARSYFVSMVPEPSSDVNNIAAIWWEGSQGQQSQLQPYFPPNCSTCQSTRCLLHDSWNCHLDSCCCFKHLMAAGEDSHPTMDIVTAVMSTVSTWVFASEDFALVIATPDTPQ